MHCRDLMRRPVQTVDPGQSVTTAARAMRDKNVGFLPVCDADGRLVGVITDRDLVVRVLGAERDPVATLVAEVMSHDVVTCGPDDDLSTLEQLMRQHHKSRVVVADAGGRPLGVVSLADLAQADAAGAAGTLSAVAVRELLDTDGAPVH